MRVVVAMSGGVDSSVAAALLVEQGYDVVGIMLKLWSEEEIPSLDSEGQSHVRSNRCCTPEDTSLARRVADQLGIPFYLVNVADSFKRLVVDDFIAQYTAGRTPNPCFNCNRHIRFDLLLNKALGLGAEKLATGHYTRVAPLPPTSDKYQLLRAIDRDKDQSYVLSVLTQNQLKHVIFPLGELTKLQVREIAAKKSLPVAEKAESQDLCFVAGGDYRGFLMRNAPEAVRPGPIRDTSGQVVGQHQGLPFYTIGQRKGIGIAGPEALYVIALDTAGNALVVGTASELGRSECMALQMNYVSGEIPATPFNAAAKIRYKAREAQVTVTPLPSPATSHPEPQSGEGSQTREQEVLRPFGPQNDNYPAARVRFDEPQRDITPGQSIVFYDGETVLGGGIIA